MIDDVLDPPTLLYALAVMLYGEHALRKEPSGRYAHASVCTFATSPLQ